MVMCLPAVPPDPLGGGGERRGYGEDVDGNLLVVGLLAVPPKHVEGRGEKES